MCRSFPEPRAAITALAGDLAAAVFDTVAGLRALAPALLEMSLALEFVNAEMHGGQFLAPHRPHLAAHCHGHGGASPSGSPGTPHSSAWSSGWRRTYHLWAKAGATYHTGMAHIRATPGPGHKRLRADMVFASSVLHFLALLAPVAQDLARSEAATVASLLASPMWVCTPEALMAGSSGPCMLQRLAHSVGLPGAAPQPQCDFQS